MGHDNHRNPGIVQSLEDRVVPIKFQNMIFAAFRKRKRWHFKCCSSSFDRFVTNKNAIFFVRIKFHLFFNVHWNRLSFPIFIRTSHSLINFWKERPTTFSKFEQTLSISIKVLIFPYQVITLGHLKKKWRLSY